MKPGIITRTDDGASNPLILDYYGGASVALQIDVVSGTPNWTVQQTLNDPNNGAVTPAWLDHPDTNLVAQTVSRQGNYAFAPFAVRVVINSGNGVVRLTAIQAGAPGDR